MSCEPAVGADQPTDEELLSLQPQLPTRPRYLSTLTIPICTPYYVRLCNIMWSSVGSCDIMWPWLNSGQRWYTHKCRLITVASLSIKLSVFFCLCRLAMLDEATVLRITSASSLNSVQVCTCQYSAACEVHQLAIFHLPDTLNVLYTALK